MKPDEFAASLIRELDNIPDPKTAPMRRIRREYSKLILEKDADYVFTVAVHILASGRHRWIAYELISDHPAAYQSLDQNKLELLGQDMSAWYEVDSFARILSGPAWRDGLIPDEVIQAWAQSGDLWWRRAALVSTVALNVRSKGGEGDAAKTLEICEMLVEDQEDMIVKAMSWALRELVVHDPQLVRDFMERNADVIAARVKREVTHKIETGLKNPKFGRSTKPLFRK